MNGLLQVDQAEMTPAALTKRAREIDGAKRLMVTAADGRVEMLDIPGSNAGLPKLRERLQALGNAERVVWLDDDGRRISEMAAIAAAAVAIQSAGVEVNLLALQQYGTMFNAGMKAQLQAFSDIVAPVVRQGGEQAQALRATLNANADEISTLRRENRLQRDKLDGLRNEIHKLDLERVRIEAIKAPDEKKSAMDIALANFGSKAGELLMLALGEYVEISDSEPSEAAK